MRRTVIAFTIVALAAVAVVLFMNGLEAQPSRHAVALASDAAVRSIQAVDGEILVLTERAEMASAQRLRKNGTEVWRRDLAGKGYMRLGRNRLILVEMLRTGGNRRIDVLEARDGSQVSTFETPGVAAELALTDDAVVLYRDPFDGPSPFVVVRSVRTGATREIRVPKLVGSAVALSADRLIVQRADGVIEGYAGSEVVWSTKVGFSDLEPIQLSPGGSFLLVKEELGKFTVLNAANGGVVFAYDPKNENPLRPLKLDDVVTAGIRNGTLRSRNGESTDASLVAFNLVPEFGGDDTLVVRSRYDTLPAVRVELKKKNAVVRGASLKEMRTALERGGIAVPVTSNPGSNVDVVERDDIRVMVIPGRLVIESGK